MTNIKIVLGNAIFADGFEDSITFVTNSRHQGDFGGGGVADADAICNAEALDAGLSGTFIAWMSTANEDAVARFASNAGPWIKYTTLVAISLADLTDGFAGPIRSSADAVNQGSARVVWTGTGPDGKAEEGRECNGWTSNTNAHIGAYGINSVTNGWTDIDAFGPQTCDKEHRIYCFQE